MKKRILYVIIALMSISLIGIIWVQIYWIHNGIIVKETQFDQLVNDALNNVVVDIEDNESMDFIHKQLSTTLTNINIGADSTHHVINNRNKKIDKIVSTVCDSINESFSFDFSTEGDNDQDEGDMEMKISINGEEQTIDIVNKLEKLEGILDNDSFLSIGEDGKIFANRFENVIVKMVKEFKDIDDPIHHLLNNIDVDSIVHNNLADNGINLPFSFGVMHDSVVINQFSSDNFSFNNNTYTVNLFKHNLIQKAAQLGVNFKNKNQYILKSMGLMVASSILFTLIIIFTFAATLHYMFKQKKLSEMKNDFINNMTHEFKTPISTISLAVDSITHPKIIEDKKQINHFADIIRKENLRMNKQVESVLTTALGEKDELEFNKLEIDLNETIKKIPERMRLQLEANNAILNLNLSNEKLLILGDEMHLQNAICNLIDNAIKYNDKNPEISIDTNLVNEFCEIKVVDNGIGMNNETQKKVFDKFYRVQKGNIHTIKGFGIGLSYVKTIVDAHKGLISLKSKLKQGTTITINILTIS
jgi:two-component system phosphate regulon sensor histidine kinase PhoR